MFSNAVVSQTRAQDSATLKSLYNNTDGPNWNNNQNWNSGSLDQWHGVNLKNNLVWDIILPNNGLKNNIPAFGIVNHALGFVNLSNNEIESIPATIVCDSLFVDGNNLTFSDLVPYKSMVNGFQYANQDSVENRTAMLGSHRGTITLETTTDNSVSGIQYQWYKNGIEISGAHNSKLDFDCLIPSDAGT